MKMSIRISILITLLLSSSAILAFEYDDRTREPAMREVLERIDDEIWDRYDTVTLAEAAAGADNDTCFVVETNTIYRYESSGSAYTDDNTFILSTADGGNTRWLGISGKYTAGSIDTQTAIRLDPNASHLSKATNKIAFYSYNSGGNETADTIMLAHFDTVGAGNPTNDATGASTIDMTNVDASQQATTTKFLPAALQLDSATSEHVTINNMWTTDTGGWSIDWWAYSKNITSDRPMLSAGDGAGTNYLMFSIINNGKFRFRMRVAGNNRITETTSLNTIPINEWVHYRVERTGDNYYTYVNGRFEDAGSWSGGDPINLDEWEIGTNTPENNTDYFDGYIDELRIYMAEDENFNSTDFQPASFPYDSSIPWIIDANGNKTALVHILTSVGTGSYWQKLSDGALAYYYNDLIRMIIPPQGADNATNMERSVMISGAYQDAGDETSSYSCSTCGFDKLDCDTGGTGADLGVQDDVQIKGDLFTDGGRCVNMTTVNASTYDLLASDYILSVTYTGTGAVTSLTLPTAQTIAGRVIIVKDAGGNSDPNNITIDTEGAGTIDGAATYVISTDYDKVRLYNDGTDWFTI